MLEGYPFRELPYHLAGDEIFPIKTWLMRPYPGSSLDDEENNFFNYRLSRARRIIENTFDIFVARLRIFRGHIRAKRENVNKCVLAATCLNNYISQTENAQYRLYGFVDSYDNSAEIKHGEWRSIPTISRTAQHPGPSWISE